MPCYHPLKGFAIGKTDKGKTNYKIVSYDVTSVQLIDGNWIPFSGPVFRSDKAQKMVAQSVTIPCGKCLGCRLEYSRQWANRCMLELGYHVSSWFVTLTYDDAHLPRSFYGNPDTGEAVPCATLYKRDFQLFMKRLRKKFGEGIRFYAAGEYGDQTKRPHYHAIIYGLELDDLVFYKKMALESANLYYNYYNSESLQSCWRDKDGNDIGFVVVGKVTWETCAYVARYIMKKQKGQGADIYEKFNIEPEFCLMSRKPGIAHQYYEDHPEMWDYDKINMSTPNGGRSFRPPQYFERLFDVDCPDLSSARKKKKNEAAKSAEKIKKKLTDKSYSDIMITEENVKRNRTKKLRRIL